MPVCHSGVITEKLYNLTRNGLIELNFSIMYHVYKVAIQLFNPTLLLHCNDNFGCHVCIKHRMKNEI